MAARELTHAKSRGFTPSSGLALSPFSSALRSQKAGMQSVQITQSPLQTGTDTVQRTAISSAISTAVILSLVDRSMASSERAIQLQRSPVRGLSWLRCDGDHAPTGCLPVALRLHMRPPRKQPVPKLSGFRRGRPTPVEPALLLPRCWNILPRD